MKNIILVVVALALVGVGFAASSIFSFFKNDLNATATVSIENAAVKTIYLDEAIRDKGLRIDRVLVAKNAPRATIYVRFQGPFSGEVILSASDRTGAEIGRSARSLSGKTDEAHYFDFEYDSRVPLNLAESFSLVYASNSAGTSVFCESVETVGGDVAEPAAPVLPSPENAEKPTTLPVDVPAETPVVPEKSSDVPAESGK